jgi:hypothetical protein
MLRSLEKLKQNNFYDIEWRKMDLRMLEGRAAGPNVRSGGKNESTTERSGLGSQKKSVDCLITSRMKKRPLKDAKGAE